MNNEITVIKCDSQGNEVFRYTGFVLERGNTHVVLEARFGLHDRLMADIPLSFGDRFVETYYTDRWFNIYEVRANDDDHLKAWYCNVAYPAEIRGSQVIFRDLALDLLVYLDGRQLVLDEDEFQAADISPQDRSRALEGLRNLQEQFKERLAK